MELALLELRERVRRYLKNPGNVVEEFIEVRPLRNGPIFEAASLQARRRNAKLVIAKLNRFNESGFLFQIRYEDSLILDAGVFDVRS